MPSHEKKNGSAKDSSEAAKKQLPKKSQVDVKDLAERILKLMKEEAGIEAEREGRTRP